MNTSQVFTGTLRHQRFLPLAHRFTYAVYMFYLDISQMGKDIAHIKWLSLEKFNWLSFYRKNYLGDASQNLDISVREYVKAQSGHYPEGKIFLLTNLTCLGYCINPISVYVIFEKDSTKVQSLIAAVTNTPGVKNIIII